MTQRDSATPYGILKIRNLFSKYKLGEDYRARLPTHVSRFLGYRAPNTVLPFDPLPFPPFTWLEKIPIRMETWIFAWIGAFGGILLIEAIMSTNTAFRDAYSAPVIITSFGASAVLLFGVVESPLSQPRNFVLGHFVSALVGTCITRLFARNPSYSGYLTNTEFHGTTFINGGLSMATSLLAQLMIGAVHPPSGATGLNAAVQADIVSMSWTYLPTVLASSLIMLGWALFINNLGRRRYPVYWWHPDSIFVAPISQKEEMREENDLARIEDGEGTASDEGALPSEEAVFERLESSEGN